MFEYVSPKNNKSHTITVKLSPEENQKLEVLVRYFKADSKNELLRQVIQYVYVQNEDQLNRAKVKSKLVHQEVSVLNESAQNEVDLEDGLVKELVTLQ